MRKPVAIVMQALYEGRLPAGAPSDWHKRSAVSQSIFYPDARFVVERLAAAGWLRESIPDGAAIYQTGEEDG